MKKILKCCLSFVLAVTVLFSFTACKTKLSKTTVDTSNIKVVNGVSTNGGQTVVYGDYLYFINGTKTNDGTSATKNTRSAICKVKYDVETGEVDKNTYEVVVSDLVGFDDGSIYIFGDFLYYATPCSEKNYKGDVLYNRTKFMRYDLVNEKSYEIYTTILNDEEEVISYSYYIVGDSLHLVVYETSNATITSLKINDEITTNYVIKNVVSCVLSENYGTCVTEGKTVDANSYVYYTLSPELDIENGTIDLPQEGVKIYRTSPTTNNSKLIASNGEDVTLLCIRAGKLLTNIGSVVYAHEITGSETETLTFSFTNAITYQTYENVIFIENEDSSISILYYNSETETYEVCVCKWVNGTQIQNNTISVLDKAETFEFVTIVTIDEVVVEDDETTENVDETETEKVQYLIYIADSKVYKLELAREDENGDMVYSKYSQPIKLSTTAVQSSSGMLVPEVIGDYLFIYATNDDKNVYLYKVDITISEDATKAAKFVGITE